MVRENTRVLLRISDAFDKGDIMGLRLIAETVAGENKELERINERLEKENSEVMELEEKVSDLEDELEKMKQLSSLAENVIWQEKHGMDAQDRDYVGTDGISAYEEIFHALKWKDPHYFKEKCRNCGGDAYWHKHMTILKCETCEQVVMSP